jgi:hypothetical protein
MEEKKCKTPSTIHIHYKDEKLRERERERKREREGERERDLRKRHGPTSCYSLINK